MHSRTFAVSLHDLPVMMIMNMYSCTFTVSLHDVPSHGSGIGPPSHHRLSIMHTHTRPFSSRFVALGSKSLGAVSPLLPSVTGTPFTKRVPKLLTKHGQVVRVYGKVGTDKTLGALGCTIP